MAKVADKQKGRIAFEGAIGTEPDLVRDSDARFQLQFKRYLNHLL